MTLLDDHLPVVRGGINQSKAIKKPNQNPIKTTKNPKNIPKPAKNQKKTLKHVKI